MNDLWAEKLAVSGYERTHHGHRWYERSSPGALEICCLSDGNLEYLRGPTSRASAMRDGLQKDTGRGGNAVIAAGFLAMLVAGGLGDDGGGSALAVGGISLGILGFVYANAGHAYRARRLRRIGAFYEGLDALNAATNDGRTV